MNDLLLLAVLLGGPLHGYALKKQVGLLTGQQDMHNNLVYPLLRRFVENRWVSQRQSAGQRGQTREVYALSAKGRHELVRRLGEYPQEQALSENGFRLRVGLFGILDADTRQRILATRDQFLATRAQRLAGIFTATEPGLWGSQVVQFSCKQIRAERAWIARLSRKARPEAVSARSS